jgi:TrmH family RNA methyltransferase
VVEDVEKPGNLGAILRSADAAGVAGVVACTPVTDIANPNTIRASQGTFFTVPIALTITPNALQWLHGHEIQILAATPAAKHLYTDFDLRRPTAIVVGAESTGLSQAWLKEQTVRVPMAGQVDSLNVAQTATILIFEAARQRGFPPKSHHEIFS